MRMAQVLGRDTANGVDRIVRARTDGKPIPQIRRGHDEPIGPGPRHPVAERPPRRHRSDRPAPEEDDPGGYAVARAHRVGGDREPLARPQLRVGADGDAQIGDRLGLNDGLGNGVVTPQDDAETGDRNRGQTTPKPGTAETGETGETGDRRNRGQTTIFSIAAKPGTETGRNRGQTTIFSIAATACETRDCETKDSAAWQGRVF